MRIFGIGTDIIEIERIEKAIAKNEKFISRFFTEREIDYFKQKSLKPNTIAGNFCAKEAISKALGTGVRQFNLKDIEVLRDGLGKPVVNTHGRLKELCLKLEITEIMVSISHSRNYAVANCIITKEGG